MYGTTQLNLQLYLNDSFLHNHSIHPQDPPFVGYEDYPYYGDTLLQYRNAYVGFHGPLTFAVCLFGILSNLLNVIVLTRKTMVSPTNAILIGLAVSDILVMSSYLPFTYHSYIRSDLEEKDKFSYGWTVFTLFHQHFAIVSHTVSTWLTVTVAVWRFLAVKFAQCRPVWLCMPRAKVAIAATYVCCPLIGIPGYLSSTIVPAQDENGNPIYFIQFSRISQEHDRLLQNLTFWMSSVIMKLVPCLALTAISVGLIRVLWERDRRRRRLRLPDTPGGDRTTRMLLAVLLLFLTTEFPSGLLALLTGILGPEFYNHVYSNFGETMDALALVNNAINFIIYCAMSQQFRSTFASLFLPSFMKNDGTSVPTAETV